MEVELRKPITKWVMLLCLMLGASLKSHAGSTDNPKTVVDLPSIGSIDTPTQVTTNDPDLSIEGWALDMDGVAKVKLRIDGKQEIDINYGLTRNDVVKVHPGYRDANEAGFASRQDLSKYLSAHSLKSYRHHCCR